MRPAGSPKSLQRRRERAMQLLKDGHQPHEAAAKLKVDRRSVRRWRAAYRQQGAQAMQAKPAPGRPSKLSDREKGQLEKLLPKGAVAAGFPTDPWTCARIAQAIEARFGARCHIDRIGRLTRALGWSPRKPARRALERGGTAIAAWAMPEWPGQKNASRLKARLVFIGESAFLMAPLVRRVWAPRGAAPIVRQRARPHRKASVAGALRAAPGRDRARLCFRLRRGANANARRAVALLAQSDRQPGAPFAVAWDRLRAHRAIVARESPATHPHVRRAFLPPSAPELDPIECLWGCLKTNPMANPAIPGIDELADVARSHAGSIQRRFDSLKSLVRHSPLSLRLK